MDPKVQSTSNNQNTGMGQPVNTTPAKPSPAQGFRTFSADIAGALHGGNESMVKLVLAEKEAKSGPERDLRIPAQTPQTIRPNIASVASATSAPTLGIKTEADKIPDSQFFKMPLGSIPRPAYSPNPPMPRQYPVRPSPYSSTPTPSTTTPPRAPYIRTMAQEQVSHSMSRPPAEVQNNAGLPMEEEKKPFPWKNIFLVIFSLALIGGGGYGLYYLYINKPTPPVNQNPKENVISLIPAKTNLKILLSNTDTRPLTEVLSQNMKDVTVEQGSLKNLYFRLSSDLRTGGSDITSIEFIKYAGMANIPEALLRALKTPFMFGYYGGISGNEPFLVLKVDFFQGALASTLRYEKDMIPDFYPIFLKSDNPDLLSILKPFADEQIKNKDIRIMRDKDRNSLLLYSFVDSETLVITTSEDSFKAILEAINQQRFVR